MKHILLIAFALYSGLAFSATVTITNSGFVFTPSTITINPGDIVNFQLGSIHNAVEVSEDTWNSNGTTSILGFSTPMGGGEVTGLSPGVHYYVCTNHAFMGMKGKIIVNNFTGINSPEANDDNITIYPNPSNGYFNVKTNINTSSETDLEIKIYNSVGELIYFNKYAYLQDLRYLDLTGYSDGVYFVKLYSKDNIYEKEIIKK